MRFVLAIALIRITEQFVHAGVSGVVFYLFVTALGLAGCRGVGFAVLALFALGCLVTGVLGIAVVALGFLFVALVTQFVGHVQRNDDVAHDIGIGGLVLDVFLKTRDLAGCTLLDPLAPQRYGAFAGLRRLAAGDGLADDQRQCFFHRRIGAVAGLIEPKLGAAILQHRIQIVAHAGEPAHADGLDTGLLDLLVDGARVAAHGLVLPMDGGVVAGNAQCKRVGVAAGDGCVVFRHGARRFGQAYGVAGLAGPVAAEGDG